MRGDVGSLTVDPRFDLGDRARMCAPRERPLALDVERAVDPDPKVVMITKLGPRRVKAFKDDNAEGFDHFNV